MRVLKSFKISEAVHQNAFLAVKFKGKVDVKAVENTLNSMLLDRISSFDSSGLTLIWSSRLSVRVSVVELGVNITVVYEVGAGLNRASGKKEIQEDFDSLAEGITMLLSVFEDNEE